MSSPAISSPSPGPRRRSDRSSAEGRCRSGSSPRIKSGEVGPGELTQEVALALMVADPLLIRRPLMQAGDRSEAGFDAVKVAAWIGLNQTESPVTDTCLKESSEARREPCRPAAEA